MEKGKWIFEEWGDARIRRSDEENVYMCVYIYMYNIKIAYVHTCIHKKYTNK